MGRFLQVDPVEGGSANSYDYVNGSPVSSFDLTGLCNEATAQCVIGILLGRESLPQGFASWLKDVRKGGPVGYISTSAGKRAVRSDGQCSSPVGDTGRSFNFSNACRTHDLGYDLMRFFKTGGKNGDIRKRVDGLFLLDMKAHCGNRGRFTRGSCNNWANIYYNAVRINSWRQGNGKP